jgi:DNA-binding response OmpR family regulator
MSKYSLLYIEDEAYIREMVVEYLQPYFSNIYEADNGKKALEVYQEKQPDVILTDIEMPQMNGLEFIEQIRKKGSNTPAIVLTAHTTNTYLFKAIELNLIKYLTKPLQEEELLKTLEKTFKKIESQNPTVFRLSEDHYYDTYNHTLTCQDEIVSLTASQYQLLDLLLENKRCTVSPEQIEHTIWIDKPMSSSALRSLIHTVRSIIGRDSIKTISKMGYKINLYDQ